MHLRGLSGRVTSSDAGSGSGEASSAALRDALRRLARDSSSRLLLVVVLVVSDSAHERVVRRLGRESGRGGCGLGLRLLERDLVSLVGRLLLSGGGGVERARGIVDGHGGWVDGWVGWVGWVDGAEGIVVEVERVR